VEYKDCKISLTNCRLETISALLPDQPSIDNYCTAITDGRFRQPFARHMLLFCLLEVRCSWVHEHIDINGFGKEIAKCLSVRNGLHVIMNLFSDSLAIVKTLFS